MVNFAGNTEFFEIIKQIEDNNIQIDLKNRTIIEIKKAHGIEEDDLDRNLNYNKNLGLNEEE